MQLADRLAQGSLLALSAANFTFNHSIRSVQAIAVLVLNAAHLGISNKIWIAQNSAIQILRSLGVDKMVETPKDYVLEIRLWWVLILGQLMGPDLNQSYGSFEKFSCVLPSIMSDEGFMAGNDEPPPGSFSMYYALRMLSSIGLVHHRFKINRLREPYHTQRHVEATLKELRQMHAEMPDYLRRDRPLPQGLSATELEWLSWQRFELSLEFSCAALEVGRHVHSVWLQRSRSFHSRTLCVNAALKVVELRVTSVPSHWNNEWYHNDCKFQANNM